MQKSLRDFPDQTGHMIGALQTSVGRLHTSHEATTMNIEGSVIHVRQSVSEVQGAVANVNHESLGMFRQVKKWLLCKYGSRFKQKSKLLDRQNGLVRRLIMWDLQ